METVQMSDIAKLNDAFRRSGNGVVVTPGIQELDDVEGLMAEVRAFDSFTKSDDPYGEYDFGVLVWKGEKVFWKIDYYDKSFSCWEDPTTEQCYRVLTVMLAEEY